MTAADLEVLRETAMAAYGWQAHLDVQARATQRHGLRANAKKGGEATRDAAKRKKPPTDVALKAFLDAHAGLNRSNVALAQAAARRFGCGMERLRKRIGKLNPRKK